MRSGWGRGAALICLAASSSLAWGSSSSNFPAFEPALVRQDTAGNCMGIVAGGALLTPRHCVSETGAEAILPGEPSAVKLDLLEGSSSARDYALLEFRGQRESMAKNAVRRNQRASFSPRAGESVVVRLRQGWASGRIEAAGAAFFWVQTSSCARPGDSGAAVWALRLGRWEWLGMLISGEQDELANCSRRFTALSASAVAWGARLP